MNPKSTLNDHINNNVGIEITYAAYQAYVQNSGAEPMLPGLDFTPNQLFWISAARKMCRKERPGVFHTDHEYDVPDEYVVNGPLRNSKSFSNDFNCKMNSPMNPVDKCEMW